MDRQIVQEIFDQLKKQGIDPSKQLMWNYYFTDEESSERLESVVSKLEADGYKVCRRSPG